MSVVAFEGPAGSGKTHRLMNELAAALGKRPLAKHEQVLALTFMHGSRRRMDARLRGVENLAGQFEATTLDSFAWHLTQRWHLLARHLGYQLPRPNEYDATCALAAKLLQKADTRNWVALSFPFIVIDEAQDLSIERSDIVAALAQSVDILLAFDEFQCLNTNLLPIAIKNWLRNHCEPTVLKGCRRTNNTELIAAARAVRDGRAVQDGRYFRVISTPGHKNLVATCIVNTIQWRKGGGNVAVLTPSRQGEFAENAVARVCAGPVGRHRNGPFNIRWESNEANAAADLWKKIDVVDGCSVSDALQAMVPHAKLPLAKALHDWLIRWHNITGAEIVRSTDLRRQLDRLLSQHRRYGNRDDAEFAAMTIQQAKNREFEHVIVLWPYTVPKEGEQRRRLLYNAITRAKRSCTVLVQSPDLLKSPPFVEQ